jgi:predicted choloylglycine hydrolase
VSIGFPGLIGCLSGMNDAGLALAVHETSMAKDGTPRFNPAGTPYALCYRRILEECTTVAEAEKLLRSMKRTTITNLAICDPNGGAVFEVTPKEIVVRKPVDGICSCTNHFCSTELKVPRQLNIFRTLTRFDTLEESRKLPKLDVSDIQQKLQAVSVHDHTLQTMIFEPATRKLYLALGKCPSAAEELKLLLLTQFFPSDRGH